MKKKILTIIGARPQFIKAAALSKALNEFGICEEIIHTGQHYDYKMSDVFFQELNIPGVAYNLEIGSGYHGEQTGKMLIEIEKYVIKNINKIKAILVYGDTNSTLAGALVGAKLHIPVIHVEAGLRSFNKKMPEEINRIMTDHVSDFLFCSSSEGESQLRTEGVTKNVHVVGDVMQDALLTFLPSAGKPKNIDKSLFEEEYGLLTIHRPSNTDNKENMQNIFDSIEELGIPYIWPLHPRNKEKISRLKVPNNLNITEPLSYFEMLYTISKCSHVITDSGGLQKEAYWLKKPCITIRSETEWIETLHNNWNQLCAPNSKSIVSACMNKPEVTTWVELYGNGKATQKIANILKDKI